MKNFISRTWWVIIPILLIIVLVSVPKCTSKQAEKTFTKAEKETALNELKSNLDKKYNKQLLDSSKVIQAYHKKISDGLKPVIIYKTQKAKQSVEVARKDTNTTVVANTAIDDQESLIFDLSLKSYNDSIQLYECNKQNVIKDTMLIQSDQAFKEQIRINKDLSKATKRNFIERNGIIIGSGITLSAITVIKLLLIK